LFWLTWGSAAQDGAGYALSWLRTKALQGCFMLSKVDLRDFFEINQSLYSGSPASAAQEAMMRVLFQAFDLSASGQACSKDRNDSR
jgi:hypothetical protein